MRARRMDRAPKSERAKGLIAINIAAIIFGSAALYGKLAVSPWWIVGMRSLFAAAVLFLLAVWRKQLSWPTSSQLKIIFITGLILAVHWVTFFFSVQWAGIAIATLTFAVFPLFTVLIETMLKKRWPHAIELTAGVAIIVAVKLLVKIDLEGSSESLGALMGLISALTFAIFGHASKGLAGALSPLSISLYQNLVVAMASVPLLPFLSRSPQQASDWFWLILLGVMNTALMHQLYFYSLQRLSAVICSSFVALEPVYAVVFAAVFFHEAITFWVVLSGMLIIGASWLLLRLDQQRVVDKNLN
jgi:drug/metabolite transporter (DMT)-like permease